MRHTLIAAVTVAALISPAQAQLIGPPSGQGTTSPQGSQTPQSLPSPQTGSAPITPGGTEYRRPTLQTTAPGGADFPSENQSRALPEQPERPVGPLR